jgi:hypothetical protein
VRQHAVTLRGTRKIGICLCAPLHVICARDARNEGKNVGNPAADLRTITVGNA